MNLLFDLDGTLTNPKQGIVACIRFALDRLGFVAPSSKELETYIGPPLHLSFAKILGEADPSRVNMAMAAYRERFSTIGLFENEVYPGIPEALATAREDGARLFVATSKPTVFARRIVDHFGLADYFEEVLGSELNGNRADKGQLIAFALTKHGLEAGHTLMIGDRKEDMAGARKNEVGAIGALWGFGTFEELVGAGADWICRTPGELIDGLSSNKSLQPTAVGRD